MKKCQQQFAFCIVLLMLTVMVCLLFCCHIAWQEIFAHIIITLFFFRLCHSLNINYNSGKLSPSGKLCLNITDLISWLSGEKKMNRMIKTLLFTGGRILCSTARNKADLNDTLSILFHGLNAVFSSTADSSFESNVWRWRSLFCFHSNLWENCWWNKIV